MDKARDPEPRHHEKFASVTFTRFVFPSCVIIDLMREGQEPRKPGVISENGHHNFGAGSATRTTDSRKFALSARLEHYPSLSLLVLVYGEVGANPSTLSFLRVLAKTCECLLSHQQEARRVMQKDSTRTAIDPDSPLKNSLMILLCYLFRAPFLPPSSSS